MSPRMSPRMLRTPTLSLALILTLQLGAPSQQPSSQLVFPEALSEGMSWRSIGPDRGGRSLGISGSPSRPNEYYFGATGGGLWKTGDGGENWLPVTDGKITCSSIGAVAVAETHPDIVYIGGGETQLRGSITQGNGVYKTMDGGETWEHMGLEETQAIARIRVHPRDANLVYVAALGHVYGENEERGIFRSTDGGVSWEKVLYVSPRAGGADLIIDRNDPEVIYASLWQVYRKAWKMWGGGPDCGLYKSTDGGDTWTELTSNPGMPEGPIGKIGVTVSPADPNRVWALVEADEGGVFRSDDGGGTWTRTNSERNLRQRAFYYTRIYADPKDRETVYALNTGFYKSTDGGETFETRLRPPHGDNHDLWIDPNNPLRMANSNDGGGNVSTDGGQTWTDQDFPTAQLYHVTATNDFPYQVAGAQQDNSTIAVPSEGQGLGSGYAVGGGESGYITQHPTNLDIFYAGSQGALLTRFDRSNGQRRDIQVYPRFFSGEPASALPERWQWTFPIVFSPLDETILYTCSQHVWKTTDDGQSWQRISPDLTLADPETLGESGGLITMDMNGPEIYATVFALAPSYFEVNTIWAGSDDGLVHITRNGGRSWENITPPDMETYSRVSIIDASRHAPGTAFVAANRYQVDDREPHVWRTRNYGRTWTKIVNGIAPGHFARAVREDPVRRDLLFLGTEHGVYLSYDAGDHWQSLQLELPDTPIRDLVIKDSDVVLATHGRGFYILDDIEPIRQFTTDVTAGRVHLFEPHAAVRPVQPALFQYYLNDPVDRVVIEVLDDEGNLISTLESASPGQRGRRGGRGARGQRGGGQGRRGGRRGGGARPTVNAGMNRAEWNFQYPGATVFDGMIIWSGRPQTGPSAPPGRYQVRLTAAGETQTRGFDVVRNPNLKGVTDQDLQEQFELAIRIRDKTSAANEAVIQIRDVRGQVQERVAQNAALVSPSEPLLGELAAIEEDLYQVRNQSGQDPLNFPIKPTTASPPCAGACRTVRPGLPMPPTGSSRSCPRSWTSTSSDSAMCSTALWASSTQPAVG